MQYQALYRKYRPDKFEDIVGQNHIVRILKNSIINDKVGHAYLFSGPRGTGKTSTAKVFASVVNCRESTNGKKCGSCDICLNSNNVDVIEIDAASNNGVDEIREIRNNSKLLPANSKYKVYIIDEVHMLSIGAFNALLKTLEEPPKHVIFILATTELQKVPLTIISRCQKFQFKKISDNDIKDKLSEIVKYESLNVSPDALKLIAELSDGGLRDSINILDQACSTVDGTVEVSDIAELSGIIMNKQIEEFIYNLSLGNSKNILDFLDKIKEDGKSYVLFCERIILYLRDTLINLSINNEKINKKYIKFIYSFIELESKLRKSLNQKILFEVKVLELMETEDFNKVDIEKTNKEVERKKMILEEKKPDVSNELEKTAEFNAFDVNETRVNNALATANKQVLNEFKEKFEGINEFLSSNKFGNLVIMLSNCNLVVASEDYVLFSVEDYSTKNYLLNNFKLCEELLFNVFELELHPSFLTQDEWKNKMEEYKKNIKNGVKYNIKEEPQLNTKILKNVTKLEKTALDIFGEDSIELS